MISPVKKEVSQTVAQTLRINVSFKPVLECLNEEYLLSKAQCILNHKETKQITRSSRTKCSSEKDRVSESAVSKKNRSLSREKKDNFS